MDKHSRRHACHAHQDVHYANPPRCAASHRQPTPPLRATPPPAAPPLALSSPPALPQHVPSLSVTTLARTRPPPRRGVYPPPLSHPATIIMLLLRRRLLPLKRVLHHTSSRRTCSQTFRGASNLPTSVRSAMGEAARSRALALHLQAASSHISPLPQAWPACCRTSTPSTTRTRWSPVVPRTRASPRVVPAARAPRAPTRAFARIADASAHPRSVSIRCLSTPGRLDASSPSCASQPLFPGDSVRGASSEARPRPPPSHTASLRHPRHPPRRERALAPTRAPSCAAEIDQLFHLSLPRHAYRGSVARLHPAAEFPGAPALLPPSAHLPASFALHRIALPPLSSSLSCRALSAPTLLCRNASQSGRQKGCVKRCRTSRRAAPTSSPTSSSTPRSGAQRQSLPLGTAHCCARAH